MDNPRFDSVPAKALAQALHNVQKALLEQGLDPVDMQVELEAELVQGLEVPAEKIVEWASKALGLRVILLDAQAEASQLLQSALVPHECSLSSTDAHVVFSLHDNRLTCLIGTMQHPEAVTTYVLESCMEVLPTFEDSTVLPSGFQECRLTLLGSEGQAVVVMHHFFEDFDHAYQMLESKRLKRKLLLPPTTITRQWVKAALQASPLHRRLLQCFTPVEKTRLLAQLRVLDQLMTALGCDVLRLTPGTIQAQWVIKQLAQQQISRNMQQFSESVVARYQAQYSGIETALKRVLPMQQLVSHIQTPEALMAQWSTMETTGEATFLRFRNEREALQHLPEGIQFDACLQQASPKHLQSVLDNVHAALKLGVLQILSVSVESFNPYRSSQLCHLPYFSTTDLQQLKSLTAQCMGHPSLKITRTQGPYSGLPSARGVSLVILAKNPETELFDFMPCTLTLRGVLVDTLYRLERQIARLRVGDELTLFDQFDAGWLEFFNVVTTLSPDLATLLDNYLEQYYIYCRQLELGISGARPVRPSGLPPACDLSVLMSTSVLQSV